MGSSGNIAPLPIAPAHRTTTIMAQSHLAKFLLLNENDEPQLERFLQIAEFPTDSTQGKATYVDNKTGATPDVLILSKDGTRLTARHVDEPGSFFKIDPVYENGFNGKLIMFSMQFSEGDVTWFLEESIAAQSIAEDEQELEDEEWDLWTNDVLTICGLKVVTF